MLDFHPLTTRELIRIGIAFETPEAAERFTKHIQTELEVRIGEKIAEGKTEDQLDEFDQCQTPEEAAQWLRKNCPAYNTIIVDMCRQMEEELVTYRDQIRGSVSFSAGRTKATPLSCLSLGKRSSTVLRQAGFDTVEQVLSADLSRIRNLSASCREEIREQLWEHYYSRRLSPVDLWEEADRVSRPADAHTGTGREETPSRRYGPQLLHSNV